MNDLKKIVIPSLQRDYVQGNQHDKIEPFIEYLLDGLNSDKGIDLNYIYGIEDDKKETFSPIDGQQRLTTLWLLRMYLISRANIINLTDKKVLDQKLVYQTREYAHDFCMEMAEHINELFTTQCKLVKIEEQNWFIDAWRHDTTVRGCISTLETIDRKFGSNDAVKMLEGFDEKLHYTIESLRADDVNGDIYIKMNGRGVPLTEYENLKSWLDKKVEDLFGKDNPCFVSKWRENMDNEWTDMVWKNLYDSQNLIDNYQLRLLYTLTFLYWKKQNLAGSIEDSDSNLEDLSISLGIKNYDNKDILKGEIADKILHKIIKRENFGLSLYVLDRLPLFNKDALRFIGESYKKICSLWNDLNNLKIKSQNEIDRKLYFWKANEKTTLFFQMFLDETLESIPYGKLALCYSVIACPYKSFGDFYEWMYRMRNLIINQDIHNGNIDSVMESIDKMSDYLSGDLAVGFDIIFRSDQYEDALKAFTKQQRDEEKHKISIKDNELQRFIRRLENHPFFVGQIKFMFDFCGTEPESDSEELSYKIKFIRYAEVMKCLFDENGFAKSYDHWRLRRALLGCSTHYGFGYERSSNWNFLSSRSDKKRFISDSECKSHEEQPHNKCLESVVEVIADKVFDNSDSESKIQDIDINDILNEIADDKFRSDSKPITDWRKYFYDKYIRDYIEQQNVRWNNDYDIYLMKKIRWNGEHVDIRVYHLYNKLKNLQGFENGCWKDWKYDIWSYEESCVYLEKKFNDKPLVIDIKHDNGTDNCFKFNVFVRDDKEKTKKLTEFTNELPGELSNDKYVIRDSITFEEVKDKIKTVIEVLEANKSYLF